ncbi:hypothetical protein EJB05_09131, partial [Eragrostis curvula]
MLSGGGAAVGLNLTARSDGVYSSSGVSDWSLESWVAKLVDEMLPE